jgi:hypothetical protein
MGRYITTAGTAQTATRTITSGTTAVTANERILCALSSGATITLPLAANTLVGDTIQVIDVLGNFASNNCTIARNSNLIQGLAEDLICDINGTILTLVYTGVTYGWVAAGVGA